MLCQFNRHFLQYFSLFLFDGLFFIAPRCLLDECLNLLTADIIDRDSLSGIFNLLVSMLVQQTFSLTYIIILLGVRCCIFLLKSLIMLSPCISGADLCMDRVQPCKFWAFICCRSCWTSSQLPCSCDIIVAVFSSHIWSFCYMRFGRSLKWVLFLWLGAVLTKLGPALLVIKYDYSYIMLLYMLFHWHGDWWYDAFSQHWRLVLA